jgi:hypothetical protein
MAHPISGRTNTSQGSSSVFDRLYAKSTESSRVRKSTVDLTKNFLVREDDKDKNQDQHRKPKMTTKPRSVTSTTTNAIGGTGGVHDRLYSKGTASYNSKRVASSAKSDNNHHPRAPLRTTTNS